MVKRTKQELINQQNIRLPDNTSQRVTPADSRENMNDIVDSLARIIDTTNINMSSDLTITSSDFSFYFLDPVSVDRTVTLDTTLETAGSFLILRHSGDSDNLTIQNSSSVLVVTLRPEEYAFLGYDGTTWRSFSSTSIADITTLVNNLVTLSGVIANSTNLGTFTGFTITDNSTIKVALQELETFLETTNTSLSNHTSNTSNPHSVTSSQVGLGNVSNNAQLTIANNLSDLNNTATARTNLGLGDLAVLDTINSSALLDTGIVLEGSLSTDVQAKLNNTAPSKFDATSPPTVNDDSANTGGNGVFTVGSVWIDITGDNAYRCVDATPTAAIWILTTLSTGELGTMAVQNSNTVNITGGSVTGITDILVVDGGTGASTASGARTNLGLSTVATAGTKNSIEIDSTDLQLVGDTASPGNSMYYGTNSAGTRGFNTLPIPRISSTVEANNLSTTSTTYTSTGISASITPQSTSNNVLIEVFLNIGQTGGDFGQFTLFRGATELTPVGVTAFTATRFPASEAGGLIQNASFSFLDTPSTTAATTYAIHWKISGGTLYLGRRGSDTSLDVLSGGITLKEVIQ